MKTLCLAAVLSVSLPVVAAERRVDLVPMFGLRGGADLASDDPGVPSTSADPAMSFGLAVDVYVRPDAWVEAFFDRQTLEFDSDPSPSGAGRFDLTIDYLQCGGGYQPGTGRARPFVAAALGLTRFGASPGDSGASLGLSGSLAGGVDVSIGTRVALRFEVRGYATIEDAAVAVACGPGCVVRFASNGWYQLGGRAGLVIRL